MFPIRLYAAAMLPALLLLQVPAQAQTETILQQFSYFAQGLSPCGTISIDSAGDLYGTTVSGGASNNGVVFKRSASGSYQVIYSFQDGADGSQPNAGITPDAAGNLYGTTALGGANNQGTIYKIATSGQETVLYSFTGGSDGASIYAGVSVDSAGNLYGTAYAGGSDNDGVVWEFSAAGQFTVLHNFTGTTTDGKNPYSGVILDAQGNLYGTTSLGGADYLGTVFKLSPSGQITLLHSFTTVQTEPEAGLTMDSSGNLYGVVLGIVFKITPGGKYTQIQISSKASYFVSGNVALDGLGNVYLVTKGQRNGILEYGAVLKVNLASGTSSAVYRFPGPPTMELPSAGGCRDASYTTPGVVADASGNIYGSTPYLGYAGGIFKIDTAGEESTLYKFPPSPGGSSPDQIVREPSGAILGVTQEGGGYNAGVLFDLYTGKERVVPFTGSIAKNFGVDSQGNFYVCASATGQEVNSVYRVPQSGQATLLYTFTDGSECIGATADAAGDIYGVTLNGPAPQGQVFRVSASGEFTSLYIFSGASDGGSPNPQLTLDGQGNVYGTASFGGTGGGVIFRVSPEGTETVLHEFVPATGAETLAGVTLDSTGDIYGAATNNGPNLEGTIYKLPVSGDFTVLYAFTGQGDGGSPATGVTLDGTGNIYGTASFGGDLGCSPNRGGPATGCGVVFELSPAGAYTVLHSFLAGTEDGATPSSAPVLDRQGNVYGSTSSGGLSGYGVVYKITP